MFVFLCFAAVPMLLLSVYLAIWSGFFYRCWQVGYYVIIDVADNALIVVVDFVLTIAVAPASLLLLLLVVRSCCLYSQVWHGVLPFCDRINMLR